MRAKKSKRESPRQNSVNWSLTIYLFLGLVFICGVLIPPNSKILLQSVKGESSTSAKPHSESTENPLEVTSLVVAKAATEISSGVLITDRGDDLLVIINKYIALPPKYEPQDLVLLDNKVSVARYGLQLRKEAAEALVKMSQAIKKQGIELVVLSAYRSYWHQDATYNHYVQMSGKKAAERFSALPGHSQHQLGTAIDFTSASSVEIPDNFTQTPQWDWLEKNSFKYGFILSYPEGKEKITGYMYEPWHYRYIGVENAQKVHDSGLILEEYLQKNGSI